MPPAVAPPRAPPRPPLPPQRRGCRRADTLTLTLTQPLTSPSLFLASTFTPGCQMPTSNRCIKVNLEGDGTFMRGQRPAPIQPMSEACMAEMPEEPVCSQRMSMSCKPGGKPTKPLYPSTIKFPGFSQNSDSPRSTGSFSKCGPWTLGSSTRNRHKEKRQIQARRNIELCKKKKREGESEGLCL